MIKKIGLIILGILIGYYLFGKPGTNSNGSAVPQSGTAAIGQQADVAAMEEFEQEPEEHLYEQISKFNPTVAEMVPAIESYIDALWGAEDKEEFTVNNTNLYWRFVHAYCGRSLNWEYENVGYSIKVKRDEVEKASRAAFSDFTDIPDTLEEYSPYGPDSEYSNRYAVEDDFVIMEAFNLGVYYKLSRFETAEDGQEIDITIDAYDISDDTWINSYFVQLEPIEDAGDVSFKYFIKGIGKHLAKYGCEYSIPYYLNDDQYYLYFDSSEDKENASSNDYIEVSTHVEYEDIKDWNEYCSYVLGDVSFVSKGEDITVDGRQALYAEGTTRMAVGLEKALFKRYFINIDGKGVVDIGLYSAEEDPKHEEVLHYIINTLDTSGADQYFADKIEALKKEHKKGESVNETGDGSTGIVEISPLIGSYKEIVGDAGFSLMGESGGSSGGRVYITVEHESRMDYEAKGFDDTLLTYVYIDGVLNGTYQMGTGSGELILNEENLKYCVHKVDLIQYAENDKSGEIVLCKKCRYDMQE